MTTANPTPLTATDSQTLDGVTTGIASLIWWNFSGTRILPDDLRDRVEAAGMKRESVPDIDPISALHRAAREFSVRKGKDKVMEAVVAHEDSTSCTVNLLRLQQQSAKKKAKLPVDTLVWDKVTSTWTDTGKLKEAALLVAAVADRQTYCDGNDVRDRLVMPALQNSACFTLRRGMYVVPHSTAQPLAAAQAALAGLESFKLHVGDVNKGQGWEAPMQAGAEETLRNDLVELQDQIDKWRGMASRVRADTQASVLARFAELRRRAELYAQALEVSLDDLRDDVIDMEQVAQQVIEEKDAEADVRIAANAPKPKSPSEALRDALTAMPVSQLQTLWMALCDGEMPEGTAELVEAVAVAREASLAA